MVQRLSSYAAGAKPSPGGRSAAQPSPRAGAGSGRSSEGPSARDAGGPSGLGRGASGSGTSGRESAEEAAAMLAELEALDQQESGGAQAARRPSLTGDV